MPRTRFFQTTTAALVALAVALTVLSFVTASAPVPRPATGEPPAREGGAAPVRLGLQIRTLGPVDTGNHTFAALFDLWLVGTDLPSPADLLFRNAAAPIRLGEPVAERSTNGSLYRLYQAEGLFRFQPNVADLIAGRLHLAIAVVDGRDSAGGPTMQPDTRAVVGPDRPSGRTATVDGAWTVKQAALVAQDFALPSLGNPALPENSSRHAGVAAELVLDQATPDMRQLVQRLVPGWLALPLGLAMVVLLVLSPRLGRGDVAPGAWRVFAVMIAATMLLAASQQAFATFLASSMGPGSVQTVLDGFTATWLMLAAAWLLSLLPVVVWQPMERRTGTPPSALERTVVNVVVVLALLLAVLAKAFHLSAGSVGAASGVLTIVLGIALQNIILDLFSGILLNFEKPFRLLNWVTVSAGGAPVHGQVRNMNWRTTQLQTRDNDVVSIPNSVMARATVNNHAVPSVATRFNMEFVLDADVPTALARQVMREGAMRAAETGLILVQPPPSVFVRGVEDYGVRYRVSFHLDLNVTSDASAMSSVAENVIQALADGGIRLAFRKDGAARKPESSGKDHPPAVPAPAGTPPGRTPKAADAVLDPAEIALVKASWLAARPRGEKLGVLFYERLFEIAPPLRALFRSDQKAQRRKLLTMIAMLVKSLDRPDDMVETLANLGLRHGGYGVKPADYDAVGAALLWMLDTSLGDRFDAPTREAWTKLYAAIARTMIAASAPMAL